MVTGNHHNLGAGPERTGQIAEHRFGSRQRVAQRAMAELEHVTEQNQPVAAIERGLQRRARPGAAQDVNLGARAEVQV
jgi:hypothetical protein